VTQFEQLLARLDDAGVRFLVVGGIAAVAHGSARATYDLDLVYGREPANLERLVAALAPLSPYPRGAPPGLPFRFDLATVRAGLNFTLSTRAGDLDLLGEIVGGGRFEDLLPDAVRMTLFGHPCLCLGLDRLIAVKRAAGRPKDLEAIAELEALRRERG
jgi:hypothetical protein